MRICATRKGIVVVVSLLSHWIAERVVALTDPLLRHPRFTFHFAATAASWISAVEADADPRLLRWSKDADEIIATVGPGDQALNWPHENV